VDMEEEVIEEDIFTKFAIIVERQDIPFDTCYKKHDFPPHFKFKNQNHDESHAVFQNTNFNNNG